MSNYVCINCLEHCLLRATLRWSSNKSIELITFLSYEWNEWCEKLGRNSA